MSKKCTSPLKLFLEVFTLTDRIANFICSSKVRISSEFQIYPLARFARQTLMVSRLVGYRHGRWV